MHNIDFQQWFQFCRMKQLLFLLFYPALIIAPRTERLDLYAEFSLKKRNILLNILINKLIASIRHIIIHGSTVAGVPPLDPFEMQDIHLIIPTGLFNLDLQLKNVSIIGVGGFVMHRNNLYLTNLTFEIEVSIPSIVVCADIMHLNELDDDLNFVVPIYSKDKTEFEMDKFRFQAVLHLKQSEDEKSILIDKIEDADFDMPTFKINFDGVIDENNMEEFVQLEQGLLEYINSCKDTITRVMTNAIIAFGNPILNHLDSWRYIRVLL